MRSSESQKTTRQKAWAVAASVVDPEIPVLTIADLGVLRDVEVHHDAVEVVITPTYSGCPAMDHIRQDLRDAFAGAGMGPITITTQLAPAWTTDWMSEEGRTKLAEYGIAPPRLDALDPILCPRCSTAEPRVVSEFGSTACKALMVCTNCSEPFDHFKELG